MDEGNLSWRTKAYKSREREGASKRPNGCQEQGFRKRLICLCSLKLSDAHFLFISSCVKHTIFAARDVKATWQFAVSESGYVELVCNSFSEYFSY